MQDANPVSTPGYGPDISSDTTTKTNSSDLPTRSSTSPSPGVSSISLRAQDSTCPTLHFSSRRPAATWRKSTSERLNASFGTSAGTRIFPSVMYKQRGQFRRTGFADSSFGANPDDGRSTIGYIFFMAGGLLSFGAKSQTLAAQSTVEAQIQALSYAAREAIWENSCSRISIRSPSTVTASEPWR